MVLAAEAPAVHASARRRPHIVDTLIEERAPRLAASPVWPLVRPALYAALDYGRARRMADAIAGMGGREALDYCSALLSLQVETRLFERIPRTGRLIVVANHPTGVADGMALYDILRAVRPDAMFYANADAHRICPGLVDVLIPVEWVEAKRTRAGARLTLTMTRAAMDAERALVIFPAGRIARIGRGGRLADPEWTTTAFSLARRCEAQIQPIHVAGPPSTLFRLMDKVSDELRDITVFHELLNKRGRRFRLTAGRPVAPGGLPSDPAAARDRMKAFIEDELPADPEGAPR